MSSEFLVVISFENKAKTSHGLMSEAKFVVTLKLMPKRLLKDY